MYQQSQNPVQGGTKQTRLENLLPCRRSGVNICNRAKDELVLDLKEKFCWAGAEGRKGGDMMFLPATINIVHLDHKIVPSQIYVFLL